MTRRRQFSTTTLAVSALAVPLTLVMPAAPAAAAARSLCGPPADTIAPQASAVTLSTDSVNLNTGSRAVTITLHATDTSGSGTPSGVKRVSAFFSGPRVGLITELKLTSGTATDGDWTGTVTVPKTAHPGALVLEEVDLTDGANNDRDYSNGRTAPQSPSDILLQSGWQTTVTITGTPLTIKHRKAGKLASFSFTPQAIDTTASAKKVHLAATFHKPYPKRVFVEFQRSSGSGRDPESRQVFKQVSPGHWAGYMRVHRWVGDTKSKPQLFAQYTRNVRPSFRRYTSGALTKVGSPATLTVTSGVDKTKPSLTGLTLSPTSIDTTAGPQSLAITAKASDATSGVKSVEVTLSIGSDQVAENGAAAPTAGLYPYHGLGFEQNGYHAVRLVQHNGEWVGATTFRRCESIGTWHVVASVQDKAGNVAGYSPRKLIAAGLPGKLPVTGTPGDIQAPYERGATASSLEKQITIDFTEGVKNVSDSTLQVYPLDPGTTRFSATDEITGMTCSNGTAIVDCSGSGGLITSVILTMATLDVGAEYVVYANQNAAAPQLTDGVGNPVDPNDEFADVTGS